MADTGDSIRHRGASDIGGVGIWSTCENGEVTYNANHQDTWEDFCTRCQNTISWDEYENGLLLTYAWVKDGRCYTHSTTIQRPLPNKKLQLEWATFRDRLTPGQKEEWTLTIKDADGKPVDANLMSTLYDQSLDQIAKHQWPFRPYIWVPLPSVNWQIGRAHV